MRYELFVRQTRRGMKHFTLDIDSVTKDTLADIWDFMENEYIYAEEYPEIYATIPEKRTPQPRGKNTLIDSFSRIRTFLYGAIIKGKRQTVRLTSSLWKNVFMVLPFTLRFKSATNCLKPTCQPVRNWPYNVTYLYFKRL